MERSDFLMRMLSPKLRYCLSVAVLALAAMVIAAVVTDGPTFLSAQTAEPSVMEQTDTAAATEVEIQRRFNELRRELLDDRSDTVEWWLAATAIFVTLFGVGAVLLGYLAYNRFREIENEARYSAKEVRDAAKQATQDAAKTKETRQQSEEYARGIPDRGEPDPVGPPLTEAPLVPHSSDPGRIEGTTEAGRDASPLDKGCNDAYALQAEGRIKEAAEKWRAVANLAEGIDNDRAARAWFSVGYLLHEEKRGSALEANAEELVHAYDKAISLKPDFFEAYNNRGAAKDALGRFRDAIFDYDQVIRLNPKYAKAHSNRGVANVGLGQYEDAIADHDQAILLDPDSAVAFYNRGVAKAGSDDTEGARSDFETALVLAKKAGNDGLKTIVEQQLQALDDPGQE